MAITKRSQKGWREFRRQRNQALAAEDAKHRCGMCKRELPKTGVQMQWGDPKMYCSTDCLEDAKGTR